MTNWATLKTAIANVIKSNGNHEITGQILQNTLNAIVSSVGENATFVGVANPYTNPGTPDGPVFYFANTSGVYPNFGGLSVTNKATFLVWRDGRWNKEEIEMPAQSEEIAELSPMFSKIINISVLAISYKQKEDEGSEAGISYGVPGLLEKYRIIFPKVSYSLISDASGNYINPKFKLLFLRRMSNRQVGINVDWFGDVIDAGHAGGHASLKKNVRGRHWVPFLRVRGEESWSDMKADFVRKALTLDFNSDEAFIQKYDTVSLDFTNAFKQFIQNLWNNDYISSDVSIVAQEISLTIRKNSTKHAKKKKTKSFRSATTDGDLVTKRVAVTDYMHCGLAIYDTEAFKIVSNIHPFDVQISLKYDITNDSSSVETRLVGRRALAHRPMEAGL